MTADKHRGLTASPIGTCASGAPVPPTSFPVPTSLSNGGLVTFMPTYQSAFSIGVLNT